MGSRNVFMHVEFDGVPSSRHAVDLGPATDYNSAEYYPVLQSGESVEHGGEAQVISYSLLVFLERDRRRQDVYRHGNPRQLEPWAMQAPADGCHPGTQSHNVYMAALRLRCLRCHEGRSWFHDWLTELFREAERGYVALTCLMAISLSLRGSRRTSDRLGAMTGQDQSSTTLELPFSACVRKPVPGCLAWAR